RGGREPHRATSRKWTRWRPVLPAIRHLPILSLFLTTVVFAQDVGTPSTAPNPGPSPEASAAPVPTAPAPGAQSDDVFDYVDADAAIPMSDGEEDLWSGDDEALVEVTAQQAEPGSSESSSDVFSAPQDAADAAPNSVFSDPQGVSDDVFAGDEADAEAMQAGGPPVLPEGFTGVWGRLTDADSGEPLIEASVRTVGGSAPAQARSDLDGWYVLALPPGSHELRAFYE